MPRHAHVLSAALVATALTVTACATTTSGSGQHVAAPSGGSGTHPFPSANPSQAGPSTFGSAPAGTAASTVPATPTSATGTAVWNDSTARQNYLRYVHPYNSDLTLLTSLIASKSTNLGRWHEACTLLADDENLFIQQLRDGRWPVKARAAIARFIPVLQKVVSGYRACAVAPDLAGADRALGDAPDSRPSADRVREALGLPKAS